MKYLKNSRWLYIKYFYCLYDTHNCLIIFLLFFFKFIFVQHFGRLLCCILSTLERKWYDMVICLEF